MKRSMWILVLGLVIAGLFTWAQGMLQPAVRDGRFGLSGIFPDKCDLTELLIDVSRTGFFIGASANFLGSRKEELHTRHMRELVSYGVTPIANVYVGNTTEAAEDALAAIVTHYSVGQGAHDVGVPVIYWEIGNEENGTWGTSCEPEEFARCTAILGAGIRKACPGCQIVMGGLLDGPAMGDWALAPYLDRFLEAGGGEWIDIYAFHYYGLAQPSSHLPEVDLYDTAVQIVANMRRVLADHELENAPIWVTETSTFSGGMGEIEQSESEQAADLVKRHVLLWSLEVGKVLWTNLVEPRYEGTGVGFFDQSGLIYDGFGPYDLGEGIKKRSYFAYVHLIDRLGGAHLVERTENQGVTVTRFDTFGGSVSVLWQDPWVRSGPVWIEAQGEVMVEDITGEELLRDSGRFRLDLDIEPVYVIGEVSEVNLKAPPLQSSNGG